VWEPAAIGSTRAAAFIMAGELSGRQDGRTFPPSLWQGAPKFAAGGFVGLRPGEVPIIAHRGELVIPASVASKSGGSGSLDNSVTNNVAIKIDHGQAQVTATHNLALGKKLNMAVQEVIAREQRSGLLAGTGRDGGNSANLRN
jgi:hypothetical protein